MFCLLILILIKLFLLLKTQKYFSLLLLYQQMTTKIFQNLLTKGLEDQYIGINIIQKVRIKTQ